MNLRIVLVLCLLGFHIAGNRVRGDEATDVGKVLIPGHCQDVAGRFLPNVRVRLVRWNEAVSPRRFDAAGHSAGDVSLVQETMTDSIGRFWLKLPPDEALIVVKREHRLVLDAPGRLPMVQPPGNSNLVKLMEPQLTATVRFVDTDKLAVDGMEVMCLGGDWPNEVDPTDDLCLPLKVERGAVKVPVDPSGTRVWVRAPGFLTHTFILQTKQETSLLNEPVEIHQAANQPVEIPLSPAGEVQGRVVDSTGAPLAGLTVLAKALRPGSFGPSSHRRADLRAVETTTDEQGRFRCDRVPRNWVQLIAFDATRAAEVEALVTGVPWQAGELTVQPMRTVRGQVWDHGRNQLFSPTGEVRVAFRSREMGVQWSAVVDATGHVEVPVPRSIPGEFQLVSNPGVTQVEVADLKGLGKPEQFIIRVQQANSMIPDGELAAALNEFPRDYALPDGVHVRHIAAPFPRSRQAYWQTLLKTSEKDPQWMKRSHIGSWLIERQPGAMIFVIDDQGGVRCVDASPSQIWLRSLLAHSLPRLSTDRIRIAPIRVNDREVDGQYVAFSGDIVLRANLPIPAGFEQLQAILQGPCQLPVDVRVDRELTEALHVRGRIDMRQFQRKVIPIRLATDVADGPFGYTSSPNHLTAFVAGSIGLPSFFEAEVVGDEMLTWQFSYPPRPKPGNANLAEAEQSRTALMRELAPKVLRDQLGVEAEIHKIELPLITVKQRRQ